MDSQKGNAIGNEDIVKKQSRSKKYEESLFLNDGEILLFKHREKHGDVYQFRMYIANAQRYIFKSTRCTLKNEAISVAKKMYRELHHDYDEGRLNFGLKIGKVFDEYKQYLEKRVSGENLRDSTRIRSIYQIQHFVDWIGEDKKLKAVDEDTLENYKIYRLKKEIQKDTVLNELLVVRQFLRWLQSKNKISRELQLDFEKIKVDKNKQRVEEFSESEYTSIYNLSKNWHKHGKTDEDNYYRRMIHHYVMFLANTGMRTHEALRLQYKNIIEEKENSLRIEIEAEKTKVNKKRTIITERESVITAYEERRRNFCEKKSDYIFGQWDVDIKKCGDTQVNKSRIYAYFNELKDLVAKKHENFSIEKGLYSFRHYFITLHMRQKSVGISELAQFCGTSISQIEKTYSHIKDEEVSASISLSQQQILSKRKDVALTKN